VTTTVIEKAWPGPKKAAGGAPRGAPLRSQGGAARLASVPGGFAGHPGLSQSPAFLGAPLPSVFRGEKRLAPIRARAPGADADGYCPPLLQTLGIMKLRAARQPATFPVQANRKLRLCCYGLAT